MTAARPENQGAPAAAPAPSPEARRRVYLHPSRLFVGVEPHVVTTVLGSCVAVCLWDRRRRIGGLNHYLLPHHAGTGDTSGRFGNISIRLLLDRLSALGCSRRDLQAKVFGGACVMEMFRQRGDDLGSKNAQVAFRMLAREGIPVAADDVGGDRGRRLVFQTDDGVSRVELL